MRLINNKYRSPLIAFLMPKEETTSWREVIVRSLQERNKNETKKFLDLIHLHTRTLDNENALRNENLVLTIENGRLRNNNNNADISSAPSKTVSQISALEHKLLIQQEELTDFLRRRGENTQKLVDLNTELDEKDRLIERKDECILDNTKTIGRLKAEVEMFKNNLSELVQINSVLRDEQVALQLEFSALEEKFKMTQIENVQLVERLVKYKDRDAQLFQIL